MFRQSGYDSCLPGGFCRAPLYDIAHDDFVHCLAVNGCPFHEVFDHRRPKVNGIEGRQRTPNLPTAVLTALR